MLLVIIVYVPWEDKRVRHVATMSPLFVCVCVSGCARLGRGSDSYRTLDSNSCDCPLDWITHIVNFDTLVLINLGFSANLTS